jgi:Holliday junction resolvase RusA-like endonuclease
LTEDIEKIAESIIDEKWDKVKGELDDLKTWKVDLDTQVKGFKSQLDTLGKRVDDAQNAVLGKVEEYNKSLGGVNVEIMAMGKVFEKIIPQFTENVNKLSELVDRKASKTKK